MGGAASPLMWRPGKAAEVTELELRIQLLGAGGGGVCYNINDNADLLAKILGCSLAAAACVCHLWATVVCRDTVWEALCLCHVGPTPSAAAAAAGPTTRAIIAALGRYRRLYRLCLVPVLDHLGCAGPLPAARGEPRRPLPPSSSTVS